MKVYLPTASKHVVGFFSGIGGFELGFQKSGFEVKAVCEIEPFCNSVLAKQFQSVPNLGDIRYLSAASLAKICRLPTPKAKDSTVKEVDSGKNTNASSPNADPTGLLPKTSDTLGAAGCPNCDATCTDSVMPACRFECEPLTWVRTMKGRESSLLPTPTASSYGSCRGGGSGRVGKWRQSLQSLGITHPEDWEKMMGFPVGWTDVKP